jgi:peptidoglycan/xylan/chitin deacetylase (PgdA/CDA1 family)
MDEALRRITGRSIANRFVNFSIDDAYRDTWKLAVPVFRRHNVPVTVYVTTGIPDGAYTLWAAGLETIIQEQDDILVPFGQYTRPIAVRAPHDKRRVYQHLFQRWEADDPVGIYHRFCEQNGYDAKRLHEAHAINWDMLSELRCEPLVEVGAHTVSHPHIADLPASDAFAEMTGSRTRLESQLGIEVRHFAFPYGRRADCWIRDFDLVRQAGYASAVTTRKGLLWKHRKADPYSLPRITINGADKRISRMEAHLTGFSSLASIVAGAR